MSYGVPIGSLLPPADPEATLLEPYVVEVIVPFSTGTIAEAVAQATAGVDSLIDAALASLTAGTPTQLDTFLEVYNRFLQDESAASALTTLVSQKAPLASPNLTGQPSAPTASAGTNTTQLATTAFVTAALAARALASRAINTEGLATGGGDLTADRTITVPKATVIQAQTATDDTVALTPATGLALSKAQAVAILRNWRTLLPTAPDGLPSGDPWLNGTVIAFIP